MCHLKVLFAGLVSSLQFLHRSLELVGVRGQLWQSLFELKCHFWCTLVPISCEMKGQPFKHQRCHLPG